MSYKMGDEAKEISRDITEQVALRDTRAELGCALVDQLFPSGTLKGMLELSH